MDLAFIKGERWDIGLDFFGKIVKIDNINQHFWALGWERLRARGVRNQGVWRGGRAAAAAMGKEATLAKKRGGWPRWPGCKMGHFVGVFGYVGHVGHVGQGFHNGGRRDVNLRRRARQGTGMVRSCWKALAALGCWPRGIRGQEGWHAARGQSDATAGHIFNCQRPLHGLGASPLRWAVHTSW